MEDIQKKARKSFFRAFCSGQLVDLIFYNKDYDWNEKMKILEEAKKIAKQNNRTRVYIPDWEEAKRKLKINV